MAYPCLCGQHVTVFSQPHYIKKVFLYLVWVYTLLVWNHYSMSCCDRPLFLSKLLLTTERLRLGLLRVFSFPELTWSCVSIVHVAHVLSKSGLWCLWSSTSAVLSLLPWHSARFGISQLCSQCPGTKATWLDDAPAARGKAACSFPVLWHDLWGELWVQWGEDIPFWVLICASLLPELKLAYSGKSDSKKSLSQRNNFAVPRFSSAGWVLCAGILPTLVPCSFEECDFGGCCRDTSSSIPVVGLSFSEHAARLLLHPF